jgi:hypothetical protein
MCDKCKEVATYVIDGHLWLCVNHYLEHYRHDL